MLIKPTNSFFKINKSKVKTRIPFLPYFCGANELHTFSPKETGLHLTILIAGRPVKEYAEVFEEIKS